MQFCRCSGMLCAQFTFQMSSTRAGCSRATALDWRTGTKKQRTIYMKDLQGKVCLVTGGTRGIGRAITRALAAAGADVLFSYQHSKEQAEEVCKSLCEQGVRSRAYQANAASSEEVQTMVKAALTEVG